MLVFCIVSSFITASLAWFAEVADINTDGEFSGESVAAYFGKGDGTKENPYYVSTANHVYNLAWLQNSGAFNENKTYFKLCDSEGEPIELDMKGLISGTEQTSGAIPPIGTVENPFIGEFDGCGSTIKNLWVSTMKSDWKEQPDGARDYDGTHVGLFGAISGEAIVENFILDKIEVKVHSTATVGIVCGYVDAMIRTVGVYNGIITVAAGAAVDSGYSLLGEKSERIVWDDLPWVDAEEGDGVGGGEGSGKGGDLVIDPNDYENNGDSAFAAIPAGGFAAVPGAVSGTAYYVGELKTITGKKNSSFFDMRKFDSEGIKTDFKDEKDPSYAMKKIGEMYDKYSAGDKLIGVDVPFDLDGTVKIGTADIKDRTGRTISVPQGGIWFKPLAGGTVSMAFGVTDKSSDRYAMLYVCERTIDLNNPNDKGTLNVVKTVEYKLPKSGLSLGDFVYYEYEIPTEDIGKYEYVIGKSNVSGHDAEFGFFALALAGTNANVGSGNGYDDGAFYPVVIDVDYLVSPTSDIFDASYINHQTVLRINYATTDEEKKLYFLAAGQVGSSVVYYYLPSGITVTDVSVNKQSSKAKTFEEALGTTGAHFSDREETA